MDYRGNRHAHRDGADDPFDIPKSGKIAVKVINHYGDEVLKVYDLRVGVIR